MRSILCVGRVGPHKGQHWLLETYARARPAFTRRARLVFVGKDDVPGEAATLQAAAVRLGIGDEVEVLGEVSDDELEACYAAADLFALFSRYEAFGLVYVEAMAHGVPVLSHRVGAVADLLRRGALLTAPFAREEAAAALVRLVNDDALRTRLSAEARELAGSMPTWEDCGRLTLAVFEEARIGAER